MTQDEIIWTMVEAIYDANYGRGCFKAEMARLVEDIGGGHALNSLDLFANKRSASPSAREAVIKH